MSDIVEFLRSISGESGDQAGYPKCQEAADEIERLRAEIVSLRDERRWIPVTERLPAESAEVFVGCFITHGTALFYAVAKRRRTSSGSYVWEDDDCVIHHPTHWQPLPPPPGGEVEG